MNAAEKLTDQANELEEALVPRYDEDELREILGALLKFAHRDPRIAFDHTVAEHRNALATLDSTLRSLNLLSPRMVDDAKRHGIGVEFDQGLAAGCLKLRICRALAATLGGQSEVAAGESDEVRAEVHKLLEERAQATKDRWSDEELAAFASDSPCDPADLEAWLDA